MYFLYIFEWLYKIMQIPIPLVIAPNVYSMVTIFELFMFTFYIGIIIVLIRYLITSDLSFNFGKSSVSTDSEYKFNQKENEQIRNNIHTKTDAHRDSMGARIIASKKEK